MKVFFGIMICSLGFVTMVAFFPYSGYYNVAATEPDSIVGQWFLHTAKYNSVRSRANAIDVPRAFTEDQFAMGFAQYRESCVACHGAPGVEPSALGRGLSPQPPNLAMTVDRWNAAELFWILKHGIRMTGMPAWGTAYSDEELWATVAFIQLLPDISPDAYRRMENSDYRVRLWSAGSGVAPRSRWTKG